MGIGNRLRELGFLAGALAKSFAKTPTDTVTQPIDFVVTWVDGNDPAWQKERSEYFGQTDTSAVGNGICRYRDWSSFRYWFRAVENYAPWVRYVHLVTWGHVPQWLQLECPKLRIVRHTDYMPPRYLPTYNCNPLELNLFRIPGLSEHFVYFNDDVLLARPVAPEDFFQNGKPRHTAVALPYINRNNDITYHLFFNGYGVINRGNNIRDCIARCPQKWFSHQYRSLLKHNLYAYRESVLPGMFFTHMGVPFCRSTMEETWKKYEKECDATSLQRLREIHQLTHQIYSMEDILRGNFEPAPCDWGQAIAIEDIQAIRAAYKNRSGKMICLFDRDNLTQQEVETINRSLTEVFEEFFPEKSAFEK